MKTKTIIIIIVIVILLTSGIYFGKKLYKKYQDSDMLQYEMAGFELDIQIKNISDIQTAIVDILDGWTSAKLNLLLRNHSESEFTVNSLFVEMYATDGKLIASPVGVFNNLKIPAKGSVNVLLKYDISVAGIIHLASQFGIQGITDYVTVLKLLQKYYTDNKFGLKMQAKGYFSAEGLPVNIKINEIIEI